MWLFLWIVFVLAAAGFFLWSYHATYEQKRAWKIFAQKYKLDYFSGRMMDSPSMTGEVKGHKVNCYAQIVETAQGQKMSQNIVEVFLRDVPDMVCVVASSGFSDFVTILDLPEPFNVDNKKWPKSMMARTFDDQAPEVWFQEKEQRLEAMHKLSKLPFDGVFLCDGEQSFVAIRTQNALSKKGQVHKIMGALLDVVHKLEGHELSMKSQDNETQNDGHEDDDPTKSVL